MKIHAHAKINWALNVLGVRPDGYHALDSLLSRVSLHDTLEFDTDDGISLTVEGGDGVPQDETNLVFRAAQALREKTRDGRGAHIHLVKRIPSQAGLGGGSADAAAALLGLNGYWNLGLSLRELHSLAEALGSDVPACLYQGMTRISGRGERVTPVPGDFPTYHLVLVKPRGGLSTAAVFREYDRTPDAIRADVDALTDALLRGDLEGAARHARNQLQATSVRLMPDMGKAVDDLMGAGAVFARMTGSGSAVFGVFSTRQAALQAEEALTRIWPYCACMTTV